MLPFVPQNDLYYGEEDYGDAWPTEEGLITTDQSGELTTESQPFYFIHAEQVSRKKPRKRLIQSA